MTAGPRYAETLPPAALHGLLRRVWTFRQAGQTAPALILPDGCVDLIWDGARLIVAGPDRVAAPAALAADAQLTGVRLAAGAGAALLGCPLHALTDQRVPLQALWGRQADALEARLSTTPAPAQVLCEAVARRGAIPDRAMATLFQRLSAGDAPRVPMLARELGMSARALRRRCRDAFGYGPKTLDRILRLQRLLRLAGTQRSLTDAALAADYADAAHLVHDARDLTGLAPTELVRRHAR